MNIITFKNFFKYFHCNNFTGATQPSYPVYPNQFTQNYTDIHYDESSTSITRGMYMYDITNNKMLNARENGRSDLFCAPEYPNIDTPCSHIVVGGNRHVKGVPLQP